MRLNFAFGEACFSLNEETDGRTQDAHARTRPYVRTCMEESARTLASGVRIHARTRASSAGHYFPATAYSVLDTTPRSEG